MTDWVVNKVEQHAEWALLALIPAAGTFPVGMFVLLGVAAVLLVARFWSLDVGWVAQVQKLSRRSFWTALAALGAFILTYHFSAYSSETGYAPMTIAKTMASLAVVMVVAASLVLLIIYQYLSSLALADSAPVATAREIPEPEAEEKLNKLQGQVESEQAKNEDLERQNRNLESELENAKARVAELNEQVYIERKTASVLSSIDSNVDSLPSDDPKRNLVAIHMAISILEQRAKAAVASEEEFTRWNTDLRAELSAIETGITTASTIKALSLVSIVGGPADGPIFRERKHFQNAFNDPHDKQLNRIDFYIEKLKAKAAELSADKGRPGPRGDQ